MKKILAMLLVLVMSVSICSTAFGAVVIGFEDQVSYNKTTAGNEYYRKARISVDNTVAKFGNYSAKITSPTFYVPSLDTYTIEFAANFDLHNVKVEDESFFDAWFYFPADGNVEQVTIKVLDKAQEEILTVDIITSDDTDTWVSLYDYWGETFGNQDNMDINTMYYLGIYGNSIDPEKEVYFYMDNLFFGSESEFEKYMEDPASAVPVVDGNGTGEGTTDTQPTDAPDNGADEDKSDKDSSDMTMWYIVGGVVAVALVAAIVVVVVAKKK